MKINSHQGGVPGFFAVPVEAVDQHLDKASGLYFKVLLAALRFSEVDSKQIAKTLSIPEAEVIEAVNYWVLAGLIGGEAARPTSAPAKTAAAPPSVQPPVTAHSLTPTEIREKVQMDDQIRFLFSMAESIYGRPLTGTEQRGLIYIHEYLGLSADVIVMAVEYCVSIKKSNFNYLQKMCIGWSEQEINTHARADAYIRDQKERHSREAEVQEMFGLKGRALTERERKFIHHWYVELGYGLPLIQSAYERTVDNLGKLSFPYLNSILDNWKQRGIVIPEDIARLDPLKSTSKQSVRPEQRTSYDLEEFDQRGFQIPK